jgi:DNA-binding SARP family transcriptional activator
VSEDGVPGRGPRGRKAWALLAFLLGADAPVPRDRLGALLFPDATDGLAALRWNLAELRRVVRRPEAFAGDPVALGLGPEVRADVQLLGAAPWYEVVDSVALDALLLEGMSFPSCPGFELWLEGERQRMAGLAAAVLREAARAQDAAGRPAEAAGYARRLVALRPWDEDAHQLLVRSMTRAGQPDAARAHVDLVVELFRRELGQPPSHALAAAAEPRLARPVGASSTGTLAQLRAGAAAMSAGAPEAGIDSLRRAVAGARVVADPALLVRTLTELGSAQVHAVRGADESGAAALREAVAVAERVGRPALATTACRELGYVDFLRCSSAAAERWLDQAMAAVGDDDAERAWILLLRGSLRSDGGRHGEALPLLQEALRHAERAGDLRAAAMTLTHLGRLHLLREENALAEICLRRALRCAEDGGWLSFVPYPMAWAAEVALRAGDVDAAREQFTAAAVLAAELQDPCWATLAGRGLGLVAAATGDDEAAARLLHDAPAACSRVPDAYIWVEAHALAAQAAHAVSRGLRRAPELVADLDRLASRHGLREWQAEAALLRLAGRQAGALEAARAHVAAVDNPVLARRLAALEADLAVPAADRAAQPGIGKTSSELDAVATLRPAASNTSASANATRRPGLTTRPTARSGPLAAVTARR